MANLNFVLKVSMYLLMILNWEEWHYLAVKKVPALLRRITSKHHFYCLNCLHSFATEKKLETHKKNCDNKDFSNVIMSSKDTKILEFYQCQKSDKV